MCVSIRSWHATSIECLCGRSIGKLDVNVHPITSVEAVFMLCVNSHSLPLQQSPWRHFFELTVSYMNKHMRNKKARIQIVYSACCPKLNITTSLLPDWGRLSRMMVMFRLSRVMVRLSIEGDGHIQVVKGDGHVQVVKGDGHVQVVKGDGHVQLGAACQG